jgi:membrane protein DedA with SNARE-associated domain
MRRGYKREDHVGWISHDGINHFIANYGYAAIAVTIGIESMGVPLPGETMLVLAAIYAATNPDMSIWGIVAAAAAGAIIGDNLGYMIGHRYGYPLALEHGHRVGVDQGRLKIGRYLFAHYGAAVVFFGRFVALLRILAAFLAGVNRMNWGVFLAANALGGIFWAAVFGFGGYYLGTLIFQMHGTIGPMIAVAAVVGFIGVGYLLRRFEGQILVHAEKEFPGPLT